VIYANFANYLSNAFKYGSIENFSKIAKGSQIFLLVEPLLAYVLNHPAIEENTGERIMVVVTKGCLMQLSFFNYFTKLHGLV
jgi:hypothetical protein